MNSLSVRELAGEIWAAWMAELRERGHELPADDITLAMDIVTGVLARRIGYRLEQDEGLPVEPLPIRHPR